MNLEAFQTMRDPCTECEATRPTCRMEILMAKYKVGYFVGSLSSTSINRMLAKALVRVAPPELELSEIPIKDLPLYSQDYDADYPPVARAFKTAREKERAAGNTACGSFLAKRSPYRNAPVQAALAITSRVR